MKRNLLGHCREGTSDKLYMVSIRTLPDGKHQVWAKWGRRSRPLSEQPRLTCNDEATAVACQVREFKKRLEKKKEPYVDIQSKEYDGPVTWFNEPTVIAAMEHDPSPDDPMMHLSSCENCGASCFRSTALCTACSAEKRARLQKTKDFIVICKDNSGMEDRFDDQVEYVAVSHSRDGMIWVYNKFGEKEECFRERFSAPVGV